MYACYYSEINVSTDVYVFNYGFLNCQGHNAHLQAHSCLEGWNISPIYEVELKNQHLRIQRRCHFK